jgi:hypothetical protein
LPTLDLFTAQPDELGIPEAREELGIEDAAGTALLVA